MKEEMDYVHAAMAMKKEIFARQGIGRTLLGAVGVRDMPLVIGILMVIATIYVVVMLVVDAVEAAVDPRVRRPA